MANDVSVQLDDLERLILAALDELRTPDHTGVTQIVALTELQFAIESLENRGDLNTSALQTIRDAREMYERLAEVSSLRQVVTGLVIPRVAASGRRH